MNRIEFLDMLSFSLGNMPKNEKDDILYDYDEHFRFGVNNGKTEEEISRSLGDPRIIAKQYNVNYIVRQAENNKSVGNIFRAVLAAVGMGFFNLVFILGPFLGLVGVLIGLFAAAIGVTAGGIGVFLAVILQPLLPSIVTIGVNAGVAVFLSFGTTALGLLMLIGVCYLAKYFYKITIKYLKWNLDIIKK